MSTDYAGSGLTCLALAERRFDSTAGWPNVAAIDRDVQTGEASTRLGDLQPHLEKVPYAPCFCCFRI